MKQYLRIIRLFWSTAFAAQLEYQINFVIEIISMFLTLIGSIFILSIFFSNGNRLGSWSWEEALVVQGIYTFLDGYTNFLLRPNLTEIVNYVREGTLDYVLLKPIDSQFWLSIKKISLGGIPEMFLGLCLVIWSINKLSISLSFYTIVLFMVSLLSAIIILYSIWFLIASTSIWFVKTWNATEVLRALLAAGRYPISAYPISLRIIFTIILPIAFLTTVPAQFILGKFTLVNILFSLIISVLFFIISRNFWNYALKFYTSASS